MLAVKEILASLQEEAVISDLKAGSEGAPKLTAEQVDQLAQFAVLVTPDRESKEKGSFDKQVNIAAEHFANLADKKVKMCSNIHMSFIMRRGQLHRLKSKFTIR